MTVAEVASASSSRLQSTANKRAYELPVNQVVLLSRQSSKGLGLELDIVIPGGIGELADDEDKLAQEARLLYVSMTRARRRLLVTGSGNNWFADRLHEMSSGYCK